MVNSSCTWCHLVGATPLPLSPWRLTRRMVSGNGYSRISHCASRTLTLVKCYFAKLDSRCKKAKGLQGVGIQLRFHIPAWLILTWTHALLLKKLKRIYGSQGTCWLGHWWPDVFGPTYNWAIHGQKSMVCTSIESFMVRYGCCNCWLNQPLGHQAIESFMVKNGWCAHRLRQLWSFTYRYDWSRHRLNHLWSDMIGAPIEWAIDAQMWLMQPFTASFWSKTDGGPIDWVIYSPIWLVHLSIESFTVINDGSTYR